MLKHFTVPTPTPEAVVSDTPEWKCHFVREELAAILKDCAAPGTGSGRQSRVDPSEMSEQQRRRFAAYFYVGPGIDAQMADAETGSASAVPPPDSGVARCLLCQRTVAAHLSALEIAAAMLPAGLKPSGNRDQGLDIWEPCGQPGMVFGLCCLGVCTAVLGGVFLCLAILVPSKNKSDRDDSGKFIGPGILGGLTALSWVGAFAVSFLPRPNTLLFDKDARRVTVVTRHAHWNCCLSRSRFHSFDALRVVKSDDAHRSLVVDAHAVSLFNPQKPTCYLVAVESGRGAGELRIGAFPDGDAWAAYLSQLVHGRQGPLLTGSKAQRSHATRLVDEQSLASMATCRWTADELNELRESALAGGNGGGMLRRAVLTGADLSVCSACGKSVAAHVGEAKRVSEAVAIFVGKASNALDARGADAALASQRSAAAAAGVPATTESGVRTDDGDGEPLRATRHVLPSNLCPRRLTETGRRKCRSSVPPPLNTAHGRRTVPLELADADEWVLLQDTSHLKWVQGALLAVLAVGMFAGNVASYFFGPAWARGGDGLFMMFPPLLILLVAFLVCLAYDSRATFTVFDLRAREVRHTTSRLFLRCLGGTVTAPLDQLGMKECDVVVTTSTGTSTVIIKHAVHTQQLYRTIRHGDWRETVEKLKGWGSDPGQHGAETDDGSSERAPAVAPCPTRTSCGAAVQACASCIQPREALVDAWLSVRRLNDAVANVLPANYTFARHHVVSETTSSPDAAKRGFRADDERGEENDMSVALVPMRVRSSAMDGPAASHARVEPRSETAGDVALSPDSEEASLVMKWAERAPLLVAPAIAPVSLDEGRVAADDSAPRDDWHRVVPACTACGQLVAAHRALPDLSADDPVTWCRDTPKGLTVNGVQHGVDCVRQGNRCVLFTIIYGGVPAIGGLVGTIASADSNIPFFAMSLSASLSICGVIGCFLCDDLGALTETHIDRQRGVVRQWRDKLLQWRPQYREVPFHDIEVADGTLRQASTVRPAVYQPRPLLKNVDTSMEAYLAWATTPELGRG